MNAVCARQERFEIRFPSLTDDSKALVFPCDAQGRVDLDSLSDRTMCDYLFARATIGRDYDRPRVAPV